MGWPIDCLELVRRNRIIADWSVFKHPEAQAFFSDTLSPLLKQNETSIIVLRPAIPVQGASQHIDRSLTILDKLIEQALVDIRDTDKDLPLPDLYASILKTYREKRKLCLIHQDGRILKKIADALENDLRNILLCQLSKNGTIEKADLRKSCVEPVTHFRLMTRPRCLENPKPLSLSGNLPALGDTVRDNDSREHILIKALGKGGEGSVYLTDSGLACKIYHRDRLTDLAREKIELMISNSVDFPGICWPLKSLYNSSGEFVGYLMNAARGRKLQVTVMVGKIVLQKCFPHWTRKNLVTLCKTTLEKIDYLHSRNIIVGDINAQNILIESESEVYFVDTDSFQIEDFPCPVGTINFTAPEIQGPAKYSSYLRTMSHEYFAVATLVFMILLPGKPPYSQQGGADPGRNIREMSFSYRFESASNNKTPDGPWRFIWSHLPYRIKKAFYETFHKPHPKSSAILKFERPSTDEWLNLMNHYLSLLSQGYVNDELFPKHFKEVNEYSCRKYNLDISGRREICIGCGNGYFINDNISSQTLRGTLQEKGYCSRCVRKMSEDLSYILCKNCYEPFPFSRAEEIYFNELEYVPPKYCKECRDLKRPLYR